ncbi:MAG: serine/threonine-protein kinase [Acidimicrobiales bacterium]
MDRPPSPAPGDVLAGRYELQHVLGSGGMATVWAARDRRLGRTVAVKILNPGLTEEHEERIEREARAAARIDDHRVVTVLDLDHTDDGAPFLIFEALSGRTLADEFEIAGAFPVARVRRLAEDLLGGLGAAHERGVLHRDVKPANVLVDGDRFRITDFGIASVDDEAATSGDLMGTLVFLAPERFDGAPASPQTDVFSAGAVLYESLAGFQPFRADSSVESLALLRAGTYAPLPAHVPDRMRAAVAEALDPDPACRPSDGTELARRFHAPEAMATETMGIHDQTEPLDLTARVEQPTQTRVKVLDAPTSARESGDTAATWAGQDIVAATTEQAGRPAIIFSAIGVVLLILLLVAATASGGGDSIPGQPPADPAATLDQQLDRIEELGR